MTGPIDTNNVRIIIANKLANREACQIATNIANRRIDEIINRVLNRIATSLFLYNYRLYPNTSPIGLPPTESIL